MVDQDNQRSSVIQDNLVGSNDSISMQKKRTSTTEGTKFRKKGISEYLAGFDNSGSGKGRGQEVKVAPREIVLDFHPKDSIASEKVNDQNLLATYEVLETPKTAGIRDVEPF